MMKAYKGFNNDMTCRGFQYKEGETYETARAQVCDCGFHACEYPLDCFNYYDPGKSVFHEVELDGKTSKRKDDDTKVAATKIKIGARLSIKGLVEAAVEYVKSKVIPNASSDEDHGSASATGDNSAASATGYNSAASATGYNSAASATGYNSAASATGDKSAASATGDNSAASATGYKSAASATGYKSAASATGDNSAASATGDNSAASATGYNSAASAENETAIAVAWGVDSKAKGVKGAHVVLSDWHWDHEKGAYELRGAMMICIDGKKYKENTWYALDHGKVIEVEDKQ